jgi:hypothetical protein
MRLQAPFRRRRHGFSLLELLIVASLCAVVFTSGSLAYRAISQNQRRGSTFQEVILSSAVAANFFPGTTATTIDSYTAPNYGRSVLANQMENLFYEDVESGNAVFCLPRTGNLNPLRERSINIGSRLPAAYDTPELFFDLLRELTATSEAAKVFALPAASPWNFSYRGAPVDNITVGANTTFVTNGSIYILQTSEFTNELSFRAVYDIDYIGFLDPGNVSATYPTGMPCVYASVRRYRWNASNAVVLTNFYDVVFRESTLADVGVPFVHFERAVRTNVVESDVTRWKLAANQPFYLIWWPDPGSPRLRSTAVLTGASPTYTVGTIRSFYAKHEGQTSYSFVVPQFPCF